MKFLCSNCFYEKEILPDAAPKYAGKNVTCPKCKLTSRVDPDSATPQHEPPPITAPASSTARKASKLPLLLGLGCGIPILGLIALASILFLMPSDSRSSLTPTFVESVEVNDTTTLTAKYNCNRIYIPINTDYYHSIHYANCWINVDIVRDGTRLEPIAGFFNIDGTPTELSCKTSDSQICECSVVNGTTVSLDPKAPGKFTVAIEFIGQQVHCDLEFVQVPVRVFDGKHLPQKTSELIQKIGFPDARKRVHAKEYLKSVDGFRHELTGVYEHWRYDKFPGLMIATSNEDVIAIATE